MNYNYFYLPYNVGIFDGTSTRIMSIKDLNNVYLSFKMELRPLSDLFNTICHKGEVFIPVEKLKSIAKTDFERDFIDELRNIVKEKKIHLMPHSLMTDILEWHFDIFELIETGEAIKKKSCQDESLHSIK